MSAVQIQGNASGTGTLTIAAPNTNTNRTLTLPDQTGTLLTGAGAISVNASTPTSSLNFDASGNVGIGTSSPTAPLSVSISSAGSSPTLVIGNTDLTGAVRLNFLSGDDGTVGRTRALIEAASDGVNNGRISFYTRNTGTNSERMRIDSSGNLLVGATSQPITSVVCRLAVAYATNDYAFGVRQNGTSPYGMIINYSTTLNNTGNEFIVANDSTTTRFTVRSNGGIANYSANNANLSDARTKTDIEDAGNYLTKICAIPVRTFRYKDQTDDLLNLGVIAQEVEAVAPELIDASGFGETPEDGIPLKAIYQTDLQYALMKCIQEQQALIIQLQADVAALKGA